MPQRQQVQSRRKRSHQATHDRFLMHIAMEIKSNAIREKESQDARAFSDYKYVRWCKSCSIEPYMASAQRGCCKSAVVRGVPAKLALIVRHPKRRSKHSHESFARIETVVFVAPTQVSLTHNKRSRCADILQKKVALQAPNP